MRHALRVGAVGGAILLACSTQDPPQLIKARGDLETCTEARVTVEAQLKACYEQTASDLGIVARHLEGLLAQSPARDPEKADLPSISLPENLPQQRLLMEEIEQLSRALAQRLALVERRIADRLDTAQQANKSSQEVTLAQLSELRSQLKDTQDTREQLEAARANHENDLARIRNIAREMVDQTRQYDSTRITCTKCGRGFTDRFASDLLSFHSSLIRQLESMDLQGP
jgi:chromosome segregation ATPase